MFSLIKLFGVTGALGVAYWAGYMPYVIGGWLVWSFLAKALKGGIAAGVQDVALKGVFLLVFAMGLYSDKFQGAQALMLMCIGLVGMHVSLPTLRLSKQMQLGQARDAVNRQHAGVQEALAQGISSPGDVERLRHAEDGLDGALEAERDKDSGPAGGLLSVISFGLNKKG